MRKSIWKNCANCCACRPQRFLPRFPVSIQFIKSLARERAASICSIHRNRQLVVGELDNKRYMLDIDTDELLPEAVFLATWDAACLSNGDGTALQHQSQRLARQWWRCADRDTVAEQKERATEDGGGLSWSFNRSAKNAMPPWRASWHNGAP